MAEGLRASALASCQMWLSRERLDDPLAERALCHMRATSRRSTPSLPRIEHELERVATTEPWCDPVRFLCSFRGIGLLTALGLLAEIGDFRRFSHPRELMSYLGLTPTEYSSGDQQHRGHITKCGNRHARRLLVEAAWHYQHAPRRSQRARVLEPHVPAEVTTRACRPRCGSTTATGRSPATASDRQSRTSPWRASCAAFCGRR
jgi:transposase